MAEFISNHARLFYETRGEGRPIVFTHGASWNHKMWKPQVDYFSRSYHTLAWDVRGHGYSSLPEGKVNSEDFSKDLIALLDHLSIEKAALCGLSMGGHISLQTAVRYPERVEALILLGTPFTNTFNWFEKLFVPFNRWSSRIIPMRLSGRLQASMLSKFNPANKAYIEKAFAQIQHDNWIRVWDAVTRMESREDLQKIDCPTLILQGDHDTMIRRQQEYMKAHITKSELKIISNAQHATNLDNPDEVNEQIQSFLQKNNLV